MASLSVSVQYGVQAPALTRTRLRRWVARAVEAARADGLVPFAHVSMAIRLVGLAEGRQLNASYRNKDYATNVLTFEYGLEPDASITGDVIICVPILTKEAKAQGKAFLDHAMHLGADFIATGHYARVRENNGRFELLKALDLSKDQSYFLHRLNQDQLRNTLFPLGEIPKTTVRKIAQELQLPNAAKKDSTGICFIGERPFREFLNRYLSKQHGDIKTPEGEILGEHIGLSFYTLGQRKGIGIGGKKNHQNDDGSSDAWYVARKDMTTNTLYVVQGHNHPWLLSPTLQADQANWIAGEPPKLSQLMAKTRYRQADVAAQLIAPTHTQFGLNFTDPQWAVTPGQSAVLYDGDVCLGGGIIC